MTLRCYATLRAGRDAPRIALEVAEGEFVGVVGGEGSGKTALLSALAGWVRPASGSVTLAGHRASSGRAQETIEFVADPPLLPRELTGNEWVEYLAAQSGGSPRDRAHRVRTALEVAGLGPTAGARIRTYSRTRMRLLAVAGALARGPRLLVLDEAMEGLSESVVRPLRAEFARRRLIVISSGQDLAGVTSLAERVLVLRRGSVVADLPAFAIRNRRVLELELAPDDWSRGDRLRQEWDGARRNGDRLIVPLRVGRSAEQVLAACREYRVAVRGSAIRPVTSDELGN